MDEKYFANLQNIMYARKTTVRQVGDLVSQNSKNHLLLTVNILYVMQKLQNISYRITQKRCDFNDDQKRLKTIEFEGISVLTLSMNDPFPSL